MRVDNVARVCQSLLGATGAGYIRAMARPQFTQCGRRVWELQSFYNYSGCVAGQRSTSASVVVAVRWVEALSQDFCLPVQPADYV